jgi:hypothetical protein
MIGGASDHRGLGLISLVSALVSLGGFVWNGWSKFIYPKPVHDVSFNFIATMGIQSTNSVSCTRRPNVGPVPKDSDRSRGEMFDFDRVIGKGS